MLQRLSSSVYQIDLATSSNQWSDDEWGEWDKMLSHEPSAYLHSKTIRAALDVEEAINKGQIYKYVLRPWTDDQISTIVREASDLYHMRTSLDDRVNQFNEQLIQAELNLEALIQDIQMNEILCLSEKFDLITILKSTITLLESPE